jgi:hypothetical protein
MRHPVEAKDLTFLRGGKRIKILDHLHAGLTARTFLTAFDNPDKLAHSVVELGCAAERNRFEAPEGDRNRRVDDNSCSSADL